MKGLSLIEALTNLTGLIGLKEIEEITAIQYEDGSGFKFNVQINNGPWQFVDLSKQPNFIQVETVNGFNRPKSAFEVEQSERL